MSRGEKKVIIFEDPRPARPAILQRQAVADPKFGASYRGVMKVLRSAERAVAGYIDAARSGVPRNLARGYLRCVHARKAAVKADEALLAKLGMQLRLNLAIIDANEARFSSHRYFMQKSEAAEQSWRRASGAAEQRRKSLEGAESISQEADAVYVAAVQTALDCAHSVPKLQIEADAAWMNYERWAGLWYPDVAERFTGKLEEEARPLMDRWQIAQRAYVALCLAVRSSTVAQIRLLVHQTVADYYKQIEHSAEVAKQYDEFYHAAESWDEEAGWNRDLAFHACAAQRARLHSALTDLPKAAAAAIVRRLVGLFETTQPDWPDRDIMEAISLAAERTGREAPPPEIPPEFTGPDLFRLWSAVEVPVDPREIMGVATLSIAWRMPPAGPPGKENVAPGSPAPAPSASASASSTPAAAAPAGTPQVAESERPLMSPHMVLGVQRRGSIARLMRLV